MLHFPPGENPAPVRAVWYQCLVKQAGTQPPHPPSHPESPYYCDHRKPGAIHPLMPKTVRLREMRNSSSGLWQASPHTSFPTSPCPTAPPLPTPTPIRPPSPPPHLSRPHSTAEKPETRAGAPRLGNCEGPRPRLLQARPGFQSQFLHLHSV